MSEENKLEKVVDGVKDSVGNLVEGAKNIDVDTLKDTATDVLGSVVEKAKDLFDDAKNALSK